MTVRGSSLHSVAFGSFNNKNGKNIYRKDLLLLSLKKGSRLTLGVGDVCHSHEQCHAAGRAAITAGGPHFQMEGLGPLLRPLLCPLLRPLRRCPHWPRTVAPLVKTCPDLHSSLCQARACSFKMSFPPTFYQIKFNKGRTLSSQGLLLSCWVRINVGKHQQQGP